MDISNDFFRRLSLPALLLVAFGCSVIGQTSPPQACSQLFSHCSIAQYTHLIDTNPSDTTAFFNRALAHQRSKRYEEAISDFNRVIQLDPIFKSVYSFRGVCFSLAQNYDLAISDFTKAIELDPRSSHAFYSRGTAYSTKSASENALADYGKAIELEPEEWLYRYVRGWIYYGSGNKLLAEEDFRVAKTLERLEWNRDTVKLVGAFYPPTSAVLFPADQATMVNPDVRLKLTFKGTPTLGASGKVRIFDASDDRLVDTLDLSIPPGPTRPVDPAVRAKNYISSPYPYARTSRPTNRDTKPGTGSAGAAASWDKYHLTIIGGFTDGFHFFPITIDGNTATIHPHHDMLEYDRSYYVQIDPGVLTVPDGSFNGVPGKAWRFSTKPKEKAAKPNAIRLTVAADGSGDFNTVQGAMDFVPDHGKKRVTVNVRSGVYEEIVYFRNKENVTLIGESRDKTIVRYYNNEVFNPHPANIRTNPEPGTFPSRRAAVMVDNSNGIHIVNMTLQTTAKGQAEGLLITGDRNILSNVTVIGSGDALQANGRIYAVDTTIIGDGDTILGRGTLFCERCTIKSASVLMWPRNPRNVHGNVFKDSTFVGTGRPTTVARSPKNGDSTYPYAEVVLLNTTMVNIAPEGWGDADKGGNVRFWEYNSRDQDGSVVDVTKRVPWSRQLDKVNDAKLIADYSRPEFVLAGWKPKL